MIGGMKPVISWLLLTVFSLLLSGCAVQAGDLRISDARARATLLAYSELMTYHAYHIPQGDSAPLTFRIANSGSLPDRLVAASSEAAEAVVWVDDPAGGQPGAVDLLIPAGGELRLHPNQRYLLLQNLRGDLLAGESITVVLEFERAGRLALEVPVKLPAP